MQQATNMWCCWSKFIHKEIFYYQHGEIHFCGRKIEYLTWKKRRRAQNRATQRAFRERTKRHAQDLETKLADMTFNYHSLKCSHAGLVLAYGRLMKAFETLTYQVGLGTLLGGRGIHAQSRKLCGSSCHAGTGQSWERSVRTRMLGSPIRMSGPHPLRFKVKHEMI